MEQGFVGAGQMLAWAADLGVMILGAQTKDNTHIFGTLHPTTGVWTQVASISGLDLDVLGGSSAYVPGKKLFVFQLGGDGVIDNYSLDMVSFKIHNTSNTAKMNIESMAYNPKDGLIYGLSLAIKGGLWNRSIVALNPLTLKIGVKGTSCSPIFSPLHHPCLAVRSHHLAALCRIHPSHSAHT